MHHPSLCRAHVQVSPDGYCLDRRARRLIFSSRNKWVTRSVFREEVERRGSASSLQVFLLGSIRIQASPCSASAATRRSPLELTSDQCEHTYTNPGRLSESMALICFVNFLKFDLRVHLYVKMRGGVYVPQCTHGGQRTTL